MTILYLYYTNLYNAKNAFYKPNSQDEAQEFAGTRPGNCDPLVRWTPGLAWADGFRGALLGSSGGPERLRWSEVKMGYNMV